jgi:LemA protein
MSGFFSAIWGFITTLFWIVLILAIAIGVVAFLGYNQLRHLSEAVKEAWSNVTVVQRKQTSLINQLLDVVKGYQESEKLVMLKISDDVSNTSAVAQMYQQSGTVLTSVTGMAQKFPELKANEQYKRLIDSIQACERELEVARQKFNQVVKAYNVQRSSIPHVFYSATLGFREATYLEFSGAEQTSDMGTLKSFSSDSDGDRLNQLLGSVGGKALELSGKALESGRILSAKAIESGKVLAENAQEKIRDMSEKIDKTESVMTPPPPPPPISEPADILYYYLDESNTAQGPVKLPEIRNGVTSGRLKPGVLIAAVGHSNWTALANI